VAHRPGRGGTGQGEPRLFGPGPQTLLVDGRAVAPVAVARTRRERRTGLLGTDGVLGALWITRCPSVHMVGMRYPIDVIVLDRHGVVLRTATLHPPWGMTRPRLRASATVEAAAGSVASWAVSVGSRLQLGPGRQTSRQP
jgi:uncharacterized membrane protein (UPF0127 family)